MSCWLSKFACKNCAKSGIFERARSCGWIFAIYLSVIRQDWELEASGSYAVSKDRQALIMTF